MDYIFGYGSLIYAKGINNRGMKMTYTEKNLTEAILIRYQRNWLACYKDRDRYLGLSPNNNAFVNGVLFPIEREDIRPFCKSETIGKPKYANYFLTNVTKFIYFKNSFKLYPGDRVFTCVTRNPSSNGIIPPHYIPIIKEALDVRGPAFRELFEITTNWEFSNSYPNYHTYACKSIKGQPNE